MKKSILVLVTVIVAAVATSCESKEEKATELIKQELSHVLYDFGSYKPIETVITEAKHIPINDSACVNKALDAITYRDLIEKYLDDAYYESKSERVNAIKNANIYIKKFNSSIDDLDMLVKNINPSEETIGYNVDHSFYYKTKGGTLTVGHYRFVVDNEIKRIIFYFDETNDDMKTSYKISSLINYTQEKMDTIKI